MSELATECLSDKSYQVSYVAGYDDSILPEKRIRSSRRTRGPKWRTDDQTPQSSAPSRCQDGRRDRVKLIIQSERERMLDPSGLFERV